MDGANVPSARRGQSEHGVQPVGIHEVDTFHPNARGPRQVEDRQHAIPAEVQMPKSLAIAALKVRKPVRGLSGSPRIEDAVFRRPRRSLEIASPEANPLHVRATKATRNVRNQRGFVVSQSGRSQGEAADQD